MAKVIPLYKSGNASEVSNYQPISILSVPSKILEQHIYTTFYDYLESNNQITIHQSGFRPKHSCDTALINMFQWQGEISEQKSITVGVTHDLSLDPCCSLYM